MRYADCPTVSVSTTVGAPAADVWGIVADITLPTRFSTEVRAVDWIDGHDGPALGARFVGRSFHEASGEWQTTCQITGFEHERLFEWTVLGAGEETSSIWRFTISPVEGGTVELEMWFQMGPGRSGLNFAIDRMPDKEERIVARRLSEHRANMERTLAGIQELAEAAHASQRSQP
jgi:Polyketide cyclase / dehydrase and lipid transport